MMLSGIVGFLSGYRFNNSKRKYHMQLAEKTRSQFILLNQWMKLKQSGRNITSYLIEKKYQKIAVYGMSYLGENILAELKNSEIEVLYGIDERAMEIVSEIGIYTLQDELPCVDAVVVSETFYFKDVEPKIKLKLSCPIVSLEEVVYES